MSDTPAASSVESNTLNAAVISSVDAKAFKPFAPRKIYYCPYKLKGNLQAGQFASMDGLLQHTDEMHEGGKLVVTPYEESPFEDRTRKVPCPKTCGRLFRTHQQANQHSQIPAKKDDPHEKGCTKPNSTNIECAWKRLLVCNNTPAADAKSFANHHSTHTLTISVDHMHARRNAGKTMCAYTCFSRMKRMARAMIGGTQLVLKRCS